MEQDFLENYKESWNQQKVKKKYDQSQIFGMLHRKSMNSVKWILMISIVEFILGLFGALFLIIPNSSNAVYESVFKDYYVWYKAYNFFNLLVVLFFIYFFYQNYKRITVKSSVKNLIKDIIRFRRVANIYILYNIFIAILIIILFLSWGDQFIINSLEYGRSMANETLEPLSDLRIRKMLLFLKVFAVGSLLGFILIYYLIIYGFFLRRLKKNLKQLVKIE